jgi:hypothetical protein
MWVALAVAVVVLGVLALVRLVAILPRRGATGTADFRAAAAERKKEKNDHDSTVSTLVVLGSGTRTAPSPLVRELSSTCLFLSAVMGGGQGGTRQRCCGWWAAWTRTATDRGCMCGRLRTRTARPSCSNSSPPLVLPTPRLSTRDPVSCTRSRQGVDDDGADADRARVRSLTDCSCCAMCVGLCGLFARSIAEGR